MGTCVVCAPVWSGLVRLYSEVFGIFNFLKVITDRVGDGMETLLCEGRVLLAPFNLSNNGLVPSSDTRGIPGTLVLFNNFEL